MPIVNVVRYCRSTLVDDGKVAKEAFLLRESDKGKLSVDDFDHFSANQYQSILGEMRNRKFDPKKSGYLVKLSFTQAHKSILEGLGFEIEIAKDHGSHCNVSGIIDEMNEFAAPHFTKAVLETVKVSDINHPTRRI